MTGAVRCRILGPLTVAVDGTAVGLGGPRPQLLFATLLLDADRVVGPDQLIAGIWGDEPPSSARALLSVHVSALRKAFAAAGCAADVIETVGSGYRVDSAVVEVDAQVAERRVDAARTAVEAGRHGEAVADFEAALALWHGRVLDGLSSPPVRAGAHRLAELRLAVTEEWAEQALLLGRYADVADEISGVLDEQPLRERARAQLMRALAGLGRRDEALAVYARGRDLLAEEQGLEPGATLTELMDAIRDGTWSRPASVAGDRVRPAQLPPPVGHFAGRGGDLAALDALLDRPGGHLSLAVVSGAAGNGKTALALQWAHQVADRFCDGQLFADLRGYDPAAEPVPPTAVLEGFLRALGLSGDRLPETLQERAALFRSTVSGRRMLILLDNAASALQVRSLLPGSDTCCVVVTSRRRLEGLVAADGALSVPLEMLPTTEAVALLREAIGAARLASEQVDTTELAALCGGLPLALRVVAARVTAAPEGTARQVVERLTGARHQLDQLDQFSQDGVRLRDSFELSYLDLPDVARSAFRRLGLVDTPGGFAAWLVAALLDYTVADGEDLCEELVDAQLLQPLGTDLTGNARYRFHDLVRLFARERAEAEEDTATRDAALARVFGALLGMADQLRAVEYGDANAVALRGDAPSWIPVDCVATDALRWFEGERSNLVAAVAQCAARDWHELSWDLVVRWLFMFEARAYYDDWQQVTEQALRTCRRAGSARGTASMLYSLGVLELNRRRFDDAIGPLTEAMGIFERAGDPRGRAATVRHLATVQLFRGDHDPGMRGLELARDLYAQLGDEVAEATTLGHLAHAHMLEERLDVAEAMLDRALARARTSTRTRVQLLKRMVEVYWRQGRAPEAVAVGERALHMVRVAGDEVGEAYVLHALGEAHAALDATADAEHLLRAGLDIARRVGERLIEGRLLLALGRLGTTDAKGLLTAAVSVFAELGAATWRAAATEELAAYGGSMPRGR